MLLVATTLAAQPPGRFLPDVLGAADGLPTAMVYAVTMGSDGRVLLATERGVSRFDGLGFTDIPYEGGTGGNGEAGGCYAIATLGAEVWAQCSDGVYRVEGERIRRVAAMVTPGVRGGLGQAPDGAVWVANEAGVWRILGERVERVVPPDGITPRAVHPDTNGAWIGGAEGLFRWEGGALRTVDSVPVRAFLDDPDGLFVGTEAGLRRIDGTPVPMAGSCYVTALARAPDGRLLAACGGGAQIRAADGTWERFGPEDGLPGAVVRGIAAGGDGTLWLAVWKRGLVRLGETGVRLWSGDALGVEPIADLSVRDGHLIVAGWDGAWELGADLRPVRLPHPVESDRDFASVERTGDGRLVVATADAIWTLGADGWQKTAPDEPLWDLARAPDGRVWASDHTHAWTSDGLTRIPLPRDGTEAVFSALESRVVLLGASRLWELEDDRFVAREPTPETCEGGEVHEVAGERWLVCAAGAFVARGAAWERWDGQLPEEDLRAGASGDGELWVSTSTGRLVRLRPEPLVLDRAHGLPRVSFLSTRGLARFGGWLVAATAEGVLWVDPAALSRARTAPATRVLAVESRGQVADVTALDPEDTFLRVRLGLDAVVDPARTRYRFRLDAGEWSDPSGEPTLQLPGLPAGPHRLEASATTAGSAWGAPAILEFTIPRRWWQRTDVRLGGAAVLAALAWVFWQERHRRVVAQLAYARELESVRQTFGRFVTPEVAEEALAGRLSTRGEAREVTVLFADLRGFTPLTASLPPQQLVDLLNAWLTEMVAAIEAEGGVVNKFIGDAVVAIFGAPRAQADHAERAVRAAARMAAATRAVAERHGQPLRAGIGVNSGTVIAGPVGAASRMEYTVIGEVVNVAARVEALTRVLDADVLVAEDTVGRLGAHDLVDRGAHTLKGVAAPVRVWERRVAASAGS